MTEAQASQYADRLMTELSRPYEIDYRDSDGDICTCTYTPAAKLSDCELAGWPDDVETQDAIIRALETAVAEDADDCHLVLSPDELSTVEALEYLTLADRQPEDFDIGSFAEMAAEWATEDAEADDEESRREIVAATHRLAQYSSKFGRYGVGEMFAEVRMLIADNATGFDLERAGEIVNALEATAAGF